MKITMVENVIIAKVPPNKRTLLINSFICELEKRSFVLIHYAAFQCKKYELLQISSFFIKAYIKLQTVTK